MIFLPRINVFISACSGFTRSTRRERARLGGKHGCPKKQYLATSASTPFNYDFLTLLEELESKITLFLNF